MNIIYYKLLDIFILDTHVSISHVNLKKYIFRNNKFAYLFLESRCFHRDMSCLYLSIDNISLFTYLKILCNSFSLKFISSISKFRMLLLFF